MYIYILIYRHYCWLCFQGQPLLTGQASVDDKEQLAMPEGSATGQLLKA